MKQKPCTFYIPNVIWWEFRSKHNTLIFNEIVDFLYPLSYCPWASTLAFLRFIRFCIVDICRRMLYAGVSVRRWGRWNTTGALERERLRLFNATLISQSSRSRMRQRHCVIAKLLYTLIDQLGFQWQQIKPQQPKECKQALHIKLETILSPRSCVMKSSRSVRHASANTHNLPVGGG